MRPVYVFPGQGSQYPGMASGRLVEDRDAARVFELASRISGTDVASLCRSGEPSLLARTDLCQLCVAAVSLAWLILLEKEGHRQRATAGHSLGEYCAACAAGCLGVEDTLRLVWVRGKAMLECALSRPGSMLAVTGLDEGTVRELVVEARGGGFLHLANLNSDRQYVVAGDASSLERVEASTVKRGGRAVRLKVGGAFHTPAFREAAEVVGEALEDMTLRDPAVPFYSGLTGTALDDGPSVARALVEGICSPVRWRDVQRALVPLAEEGQVEVGPGRALNAMARRDYPHLTVYHASELVRSA